MIESSKFIKINKRRRSRGYSHEHNDIVGKLIKAGWRAYRLGGSSANLPDVVASSTSIPYIMYAIEAKSVSINSSNYAYVPRDQVERCAKILDVFPAYDYRYIILAFKFSFGTRKTPLFYYYKMDWAGPFDKESFEEFDYIRCHREGRLDYRIPGAEFKKCNIFQRVERLPFRPKIWYVE